MEPLYRLGEVVVPPLLESWFRCRLEGLHHVPRRGPLLVACNHISYFDLLAHAYFLLKAHRRPRFIAKIELYRNPLLRWVLEQIRQIPVHRGTGDPAPVEAAKRALREGEAVVLYPEGTVNRDPMGPPKRGKTGIARLTLSTGVPVLPLAIWGAQRVWQREGKVSLKRGRPIWLKAAAPMEFSATPDGADDAAMLRKVTDEIMAEVGRLAGDLSSRYPIQWTAI